MEFPWITVSFGVVSPSHRTSQCRCLGPVPTFLTLDPFVPVFWKYRMRFFQDEPQLSDACTDMSHHELLDLAEKDLSALQFYGGLFNLHPLAMKPGGPIRSAATRGLKIIVSRVLHSYQNFLLLLLRVHGSPFPLAGAWNALHPVLCMAPCAWAHSCEFCPG